MDERRDTDDTAETTQTDSADRISVQRSAQHKGTSDQTHSNGSDHTTTVGSSCVGKDRGDEKIDPRESSPAGPPNGEQLQAVVAQVSHDLRSQLNVAYGRLDMARQGDNDDDLANVATALNRMETLIEDLEEGATADVDIPGIERVSLPEFVDQCWQNVVSDEAALHNTSTLTVQAGPSGLKRVLENLFRNAIEHNDADVRLEVGDLDRADGFYVADDGSGIPEHVRGAEFEPGISTGRDGSGLGLSIVARIVESHDWHIRVTESEAGGARFEITEIDCTVA